MGAAEHIEWSGEYPALLWSLHPCESIDDPIEPVNDNARRLTMVERRNAPQSEESFPHARAGVLCDNEYRSVEACTPSTRQGEAQLAQAHRAEQAGGWGLPNYRFTGKEEDVEVGLQYFGKRYLNPLLGRWVSADPLAIHAPGEADLNVYAYVSGQVLRSIDPLGLEASEAQRQVESENNLQNYFDPDSRQNQSYNQSPGGTSPAPGGDGNSYNGDNEYNNGIGDPNAAPITNPHDPLNGKLDGASGPKRSSDSTSSSGSTPSGENLNFFERLSRDFATAVAILGGDSDGIQKANESTSEKGMPGGRGSKDNATSWTQNLYSMAAGFGGRAFDKAKKGYRALKEGVEAIGTELAAKVAAKGSLSATKSAVRKAQNEVGGSLPPGKPGKFGSPQRGTSKKGYRLDPGHPERPPGHPEHGPHVNWWDYTGGKRDRGGRDGVFPIED